MNVIFAGTPDFAAYILAAMIQAKINIVAVLTQPDRPSGRGLNLKSSEVKQLALQHDLLVLQPHTLKSQEKLYQQLQLLNADLMVVAAYGLIIPPQFLTLPKYGCINVHASLLPRWRGAAPIQRAIEAGDATTGISIMQMDSGLDTGDVLSQQEVAILETDTAATLHDKLKIIGANLCVVTLQRLPYLESKPQSEEGVAYAHKINKSEAIINWQDPALEIIRKIRAFNPYPVAKTRLENTELKIWQAKYLDESCKQQAGEIIAVNQNGIKVAATGGAVLIEVLQKSGGKKMMVADFLLGNLVEVGTILG